MGPISGICLSREAALVKGFCDQNFVVEARMQNGSDIVSAGYECQLGSFAYFLEFL